MVFQSFIQHVGILCIGEGEFPVRSKLQCAAAAAGDPVEAFQVIPSSEGMQMCTLCSSIQAGNGNLTAIVWARRCFDG